ncbi:MULTISPECIES: GDSL-type esterase/lipase family protein [Clostridium]|uniref:Lipase n=1 Tax=Clostridium cadaveris TaxID=1529 RepID=A0A1I2NWK2_9CLOT|nr:GDSL-type esterase/lipase family protein [Clostridium cadaveris]MDU4952882.1 GDSL-type esterase/lipase family protein [Clostridium sp.]MDM8312559.1 GDSL-type esterase/lipase family protein [Clostridium cadaveris]NME65728.1 lipase [Clostridium cadaveris]NWK12246.1 lipase [Clostridium cadaveris]PWL54786.1 MAG: lipase [Clostridium cadaveris]
MNKITCIGDSLTFGYGVSKDKKWIDILAKELPQYEVLNKGVNGDTTSGLLSRFYQDVILNKPEKTIITIGSNDFLTGRTVDSAFENLKLLIKESKENAIGTFIGIEPLICADLAKEYWCSYLDYSIINSKISLYRYKILNYCKEKSIDCIDFYDLFENLNSKLENHDMFLDGLHPKEEIHKIMAKEVIKIINR